MDLAEIKERIKTGVHPVSDQYVDWLIAEVERLSAQAQDAEQRTFRYGEEAKALEERVETAEAERDRYKTELDQIAKLPVDYPLSAVKRKATAAAGYYRKDNKGRKR